MKTCKGHCKTEKDSSHFKKGKKVCKSCMNLFHDWRKEGYWKYVHKEWKK